MADSWHEPHGSVTNQGAATNGAVLSSLVAGEPMWRVRVVRVQVPPDQLRIRMFQPVERGLELVVKILDIGDIVTGIAMLSHRLGQIEVDTSGQHDSDEMPETLV